jgi:hypothetical protein
MMKLNEINFIRKGQISKKIQKMFQIFDEKLTRAGWADFLDLEGMGLESSGSVSLTFREREIWLMSVVPDPDRQLLVMALLELPPFSCKR